MSIKICLDAGHFAKYNRSPAIPEYYESDMNWKLHLLLKKYLEQYGVEVICTRKDQAKDMGLTDRGQAAKGCNLLLSIHSNATGNGEVRDDVDYPVVYVPINGTGDAIGKKLADCIASVMGTKQPGRAVSRKGSGNWDYYSVIYGAVSVGVTGLILEHSFHTNTRSTKWLLDDNNLDKLAKAEADVIAAHYGLKKPEKPTVEPEHWYRVRKSWEDAASQIGAYKVLENAKTGCPEGYSVFDWNGNTVYYNGGGEFVTDAYPLEEFVRDIQKACGAAVDGIAGPETLGKTVTLSQYINTTHAAVKPVQKRLYALGYTEVGEADGITGPKFDAAVKAFQNDNDCYVDGEITAQNKTWRKLLGMG